MPNLDEPWLAALCFLETAKARRDRAMKRWEKELEDSRLTIRDHERIEHETKCAWMEYLERDWEHR